MSKFTLFAVVVLAVFISSNPVIGQTIASEGIDFAQFDGNEDGRLDYLDLALLAVRWNPALSTPNYYPALSIYVNTRVDRYYLYSFYQAWSSREYYQPTAFPTVTPTTTPIPPTPTPTVTPTPRPQSGWVQIFPPESPPARSDHAMSHDIVNKVIILFGGEGEWTQETGSAILGDTWEWDGEQWMQINPILSPSPRRCHAMTYNTATNRVILFGGVDENDRMLNDMWEWDGINWTLVANTGPDPRFITGMVYDVYRKKIVLFGGAYFDSELSDTWEWDGKKWTQINPPLSPDPRHGHTMVYDAYNKKIILFGGSLEECEEPEYLVSDTWEWDGIKWALVANSGPDPRHGHTMAYDNVRKKVVLFGGKGYGYVSGRYRSINFDDTWEWDGKKWTQVMVDGTPIRNTSIAYDATHNYMVLFGGSVLWGYPVNDTWKYIP